MPSDAPGLPTLRELASLKLPALRACYVQLQGHAAPRSAKADVLRGYLAWAIQALQQKQNPVALRQSFLEEGRDILKQPAKSSSPGVRLIREWQGVVHEVTVLDSGYLYQGERYRSLSPIAERITGAHWSGPRFFGLSPGKENHAA